jgi:phosphoribosyl 1,2-cyclic phosphodiesterase
MERIYGFDSHDRFAIGDLEIRPFPVPHDAREPVQFVVTDGMFRVGVVTDLGTTTRYVEASLSGCGRAGPGMQSRPDLLEQCDYPTSLKARISGRFGICPTDGAAAIIRAIDTSRLQHLIAAHLSRQNNTPTMARAALGEAIGCGSEWIGVATQETGFEWRGLA